MKTTFIITVIVTILGLTVAIMAGDGDEGGGLANNYGANQNNNPNTETGAPVVGGRSIIGAMADYHEAVVQGTAPPTGLIQGVVAAFQAASRGIGPSAASLAADDDPSNAPDP